MDLSYILLILFIITYLTLWCYAHFYEITTPFRFIRTDLQNTPYVTINDSFYTKNDCTDLVHKINHSGFVISNPLNAAFKRLNRRAWCPKSSGRVKKIKNLSVRDLRLLSAIQKTGQLKKKWNCKSRWVTCRWNIPRRCEDDEYDF